MPYAKNTLLGSISLNIFFLLSIESLFENKNPACSNLVRRSDRTSFASIFRIDFDSNSNQSDIAERGSGIGLVLCKEMVEKNKGEIWVKSQKGRGVESSTEDSFIPFGDD